MAMLLCLFSAFTAFSVASSDTTIVLALHQVDLTGDGEAEILQVIGVGESLDSLELTFSITFSDETLYTRRLRPLTRKIGFDAVRGVRTEAEQRELIQEYGSFFFASSKFRTTEGFMQKLMGSGRAGATMIADIPNVIAAQKRKAGDDDSDANRVWEKIKRSGVLTFEYSGGGDSVTAIAWSQLDQRFYELWHCC
jgi:hypothetical protein